MTPLAGHGQELNVFAAWIIYPSSPLEKAGYKQQDSQGEKPFGGRYPLLGTQSQLSLVLLQVYLPNEEINSEYFMALITPPCM